MAPWCSRSTRRCDSPRLRSSSGRSGRRSEPRRPDGGRPSGVPDSCIYLSSLQVTAVIGGSISFVERVIHKGIFGTTYPMFGFETTLSERLRDPALADYIRWEYRPADQPRIVLSVRGGSIRSARRSRRPRRRGVLRHLRMWTA